MDEINKIGDIHSINDLFDFKLSIKTIIFLGFAWAAACIVVIVFLFGGINNTVAYGINIIESVKTTVLERRNKTIIKPLERPADTNTEKNADKNND